MEENCAKLGYGIIMPSVLKRDVLGKLHTKHVNIVNMKIIGRVFCLLAGIK